MKSASSDNEFGIQQERKGIWHSLKILVGLIISLEALFNLTDAERQDAGIHIERQGEE